MWYKRYILGEWAVAHGLIYDGYDHDNLFEHQLDTPNFYIIGIDYGTSNATAAVLLAVSPKRWPQIRVEAEYYYDSAKKGRSKTDSELVSDIKDFIGWRSIRTIYVDPSAASLKLELRSRDLPVIDAKNDVLAGIKITSKFISNKNIVIHKSCKTVIETLQSYCWDPKAADRGEDKPLKEREHIVDALRYAVFSAFPSGEISHPDENLTIEEIRRNVYGTDDLLGFHQGTGGYV
jgi:PBSX family phage terminase large subunit